jgi:hypothetical protein
MKSGRPCPTLSYRAARSMLTLHTRIALLTLLPVLLWGAVRFVEGQRAEPSRTEPLSIGIHHDGNAAVTLTKSVGTRPQLIDIGNDGAGTVRISLPASWERGEIRGAALASIVADEAMYGERRWHIPAGATLSFRNALPPRSWTIRNPSGLPLRLRIVTADMEAGTVEREVYLLAEEPVVIE